MKGNAANQLDGALVLEGTVVSVEDWEVLLEERDRIVAGEM